MASILLIQSDPSTAQHLQDALGDDERYVVSASVASLAEARRLLAARTPDLLISDLRLPDGALRDLLRGLRVGRPHVLASTASLHDPHLMHALRSGAHGFLLQREQPQAVLDTVQLMLAGGSPITPEIARRLLALGDVLNARPLLPGEAPNAGLAKADRLLLEWTSQGYSQQEVARGLAITPIEVGIRVRVLYRRVQFERPISRVLARCAA